MTTQARIAANRRNATRSTGPRTLAGKARASTNAVTHGLTARLDVMLPGEDPAACQEFGAGMLAELVPVGTVERFYAQRAAWLAWRLSRVPGIESAVLAATSAELQRDGALGTIEEARDRFLFTTPEAIARRLTNGDGPPPALSWARRLEGNLTKDAPAKIAEAKAKLPANKKRKVEAGTGALTARYEDQAGQAMVDGARAYTAAEKRLRAEPVLSGRAFAIAASRGTWDALGRYERTLTRDLERTIAALRAEQVRRTSGSN